MPDITICNIAKKKYEPNGFKIQRSYAFNSLWIRPCEENESYTTFVVADHTDVKVDYITYNPAEAIRTPITVTAQQIVTDFFGNERLAAKGCFIPAGPLPTNEELAQAHAARREYLQKCVNDGNVEYSRTQRVDDIPGEWKRACVELGVQTDWAFVAPPEMFECPVCAERLKVGVALCKSCGAILDREKAEKFGLLEEREPAQPAKGAARRKKSEPAHAVSA